MKIIALAATLLIATESSNAATIWTAPVLSGAQETVANGSTATGNGLVKLLSDGKSLAVRVEWSGLVGGNAAAAHIHCCALLGFNGPVAVDLEPNPVTTGSAFNIFDLDLLSSYGGGFLAANGGTAASAKAALLAGLDSGTSYFNVHNGQFPAGEIRGQIAPGVPEPASWAMLIIGFGLVGHAVRRRTAIAA